MNILFVCTGNTCRSPMAETLMDDVIDRSSGLRGNVKTASVGTFACDDAEATPEAIRVMEEKGLSLVKHESEQFSEEWAEWADIILAMSKEQIEHMEAIAPESAAKMHTLLGYIDGVAGDPVDERYDVPDPFGEDINEYRRCAEILQDAVQKLAGILLNGGLTDNKRG